MIKQEIIGEGILNWFKNESITGRYGMVFLEDDKNQDPSIFKTVSLTSTLVGEYGNLITNALNQNEVLGTGKLLINSDLGFDMTGVIPADNRSYNWLNPDILHKLHNQKVKLIFTLE